MAEDGHGSTQNSALHFPLTTVGGCQDLALKLVLGTVIVRRAKSCSGQLLGLGRGSLGHPHFSWASGGGPRQIQPPPNTFTSFWSSSASASQRC